MQGSESTHQLVRKLLAAAPTLSAVYCKHITDNDELLPHVFFGDLTRVCTRTVGISTIADHSDVGRILDLLEREFITGDEDVKELISVSFLENLVQTESYYSTIKAYLGPSLTRELETYEQ